MAALYLPTQPDYKESDAAFYDVLTLMNIVVYLGKPQVLYVGKNCLEVETSS